MDCYCVCHSPVSSSAYCEHCKGFNEVTFALIRRETIAECETILRNFCAEWERTEAGSLVAELADAIAALAEAPGDRGRRG